jgi:hypothetical protein
MGYNQEDKNTKVEIDKFINKLKEVLYKDPKIRE